MLCMTRRNIMRKESVQSRCGSRGGPVEDGHVPRRGETVEMRLSVFTLQAFRSFVTCVEAGTLSREVGITA
jgi:hypothetical protein